MGAVLRQIDARVADQEGAKRHEDREPAAPKNPDREQCERADGGGVGRDGAVVPADGFERDVDGGIGRQPQGAQRAQRVGRNGEPL